MHRPGSREPALHDRAMDNLRFIRDTMERAGPFTSVSGAGMMGVGALGVLAAIASYFVPITGDPVSWLAVWIATAAGAVAASGAAMRAKARRTGQSLSAGPARRFALAFAPGMVAGAVLTLALYMNGSVALLPGTWLTVYGAAVTAGGALSVRPVPVMGAVCLVLGIACFFAPVSWAPAFLGAGFGVVHLVFGLRIARNYGG